MKEDPWHDREEAFLTKIEQQCNDYAAHHTKDHMYYNKLSSRFNIPILVVSSINALTAISLSSFLKQEYVSILNAVLSAGMTNALRASILMKRLALKISKELSIDRELRSTEGQAFLQESFAEFNTALEQGNPIEKKLRNHLSLIDPGKLMDKKMSLMSLANAAVDFVGTPRRSTIWNEATEAESLTPTSEV